jgi:hypothetical protein
VLLNPLVYMSEGMRVSLTLRATHGVLGHLRRLILFAALLGALGISGFTKRVQT